VPAASAPEVSGGGDTSYDRVGVPQPSGGVQFLSRQEFEALALVDRVRLLVEGKLQFFRGDRLVPPRQALRDR